jgi:hypothetical protein
VDGHPGTKRLICLPCFRELPVQPYDNMGFVLIEYDVRVQLVAWHRWYLGMGLASMVDFSFWKVSSHSSLSVEWVLRWKCTTPVGCKTNRLAVSRLWKFESLEKDVQKNLITFSEWLKIGFKTISGQWLLKDTYLAINPGFVWWFSLECHPGWLLRATYLAVNPWYVVLFTFGSSRLILVVTQGYIPS